MLNTADSQATDREKKLLNYTAGEGKRNLGVRLGEKLPGKENFVFIYRMKYTSQRIHGMNSQSYINFEVGFTQFPKKQILNSIICFPFVSFLLLFI